MRHVMKHWQSVAVAAVIVIINLYFVLGVGLAYGHFDWTLYASAYLPVKIFLPFVSK